MTTKSIITVGRQYGSGGRYVAKLLAERLEIPYYDKELLAEVAKDSGIGKDLLEEHDEKNTRNFLFSMMSGSQPFADSGAMYMDMPLNHRIFLAQFDTIRRIAGEGPCVIVGRCADYVLRDEPHVLNVFIKASQEERIRRVVKYYGVDPLKAEEKLRKADKQRASYYNYYATNTWGDVNNYDLCVDTGTLGIEGSVELIAKCVELRDRFLDSRKEELDE
ncbi:MAG: cytidylate kinase-like family protein [Clostridiales bacterium]|nr:cytidylate kinase-like family protein [Clostridiales bacterium]